MRHTCLYFLAIAVLCVPARAQDTFSIVAVDPQTGEVGSAGASCVPFDVAIISDLAPGIGASNTQAYYIPNNQTFVGFLLRDLVAPAAIIDSVVNNDIQGTPGRRQYGIATLAGGGSTAAYTGELTDDVKGHRLGATYAVQGNILLHAGILDSIALRFERSTGALADRLMYALLGARVAGADSRCGIYGTSSLGAFLRVARPGDREDSIYVDLRASIPNGSVEPLDSLASLFAQWRATSSVTSDHSARDVGVTFVDRGHVVVHVDLVRTTTVQVDIYDVTGRRMATSGAIVRDAGGHEVRLNVAAGASTARLYARITCGDVVVTRSLTVVR